jgi:hypothetical protein
MVNYFKFIFYIIFFISKDNLFKLFIIASSVICFNYAGTIEDTKYEYQVSKELKIDDFYIYITKDIRNNKVEYDIIQFNEPMEIKDGKLIWYEYSGLNSLLWAIFTICVFLVFFATFFDQHGDISWDIESNYDKALIKMFHTEYENDIYYYVAFDRLISKRSNIINRRELLYEFDIKSLSDILYHPKFEINKNE